jgi:hypothetical protein
MRLKSKAGNYRLSSLRHRRSAAWDNARNSMSRSEPIGRGASEQHMIGFSVLGDLRSIQVYIFLPILPMMSSLCDTSVNLSCMVGVWCVTNDLTVICRRGEVCAHSPARIGTDCTVPNSTQTQPKLNPGNSERRKWKGQTANCQRRCVEANVTWWHSARLQQGSEADWLSGCPYPCGCLPQEDCIGAAMAGCVICIRSYFFSASFAFRMALGVSGPQIACHMRRYKYTYAMHGMVTMMNGVLLKLSHAHNKPNPLPSIGALVKHHFHSSNKGVRMCCGYKHMYLFVGNRHQAKLLAASHADR